MPTPNRANGGAIGTKTNATRRLPATTYPFEGQSSVTLEIAAEENVPTGIGSDSNLCCPCFFLFKLCFQ